MVDNMFAPGKATVVIGGQWGSEGKGKLYSYLYENFPIDAVVSDFTPSAGHTAWVSSDTVKVVSKALPIGAHFPKVETVVLGPHSIVNQVQLAREIEGLGDTRGEHLPRIYVDPMVSILEADDAKKESESLRDISSTLQGGSEALIRKIRRVPLSRKQKLLWGEVGRGNIIPQDTSVVVDQLLNREGTILIETAQGFDLGLNHGHSWPYVTSRDCMIGRVLDNAGISYKRVQSVIGVIRTFPIRVGSLPGFTSGPYYQDQEELDWARISEVCGKTVLERTTVTNRIRRVFSFSWFQLDRFLHMVQPDFLCLNFADYLGEKIHKHPFIHELHTYCLARGCRLCFVGFGPRNSEMVDLS